MNKDLFQLLRRPLWCVGIAAVMLASCGGGNSGETGPAAESTLQSEYLARTKVVTGKGTTLSVSTAAELTNALSRVIPGDTIELKAGVYSGNFTITRSGTSSKPIRLAGPANAVLQSNAMTGNRYGLYLNQAKYWVLDGFTVRNSKKGIVLDVSSNNTMQNLIVHDTEEEGIHLRTFSTDNTIKNSNIYNTGLLQPGYGEGIYIGSAVSKWGTYTNGNPDTSDRNHVISNKIGPNVAAEGIDIKEGTTGGTIMNNVFDGSGISGSNFADSVMDVKGNGYTIKGNKVTYTPTASSKILLDGFQAHQATPGWGNDNIFCSNSFDLNTTGDTSLNALGYGIDIKSNLTGNLVGDNNTAAHGNGKVTNIAMTNCPAN